MAASPTLSHSNLLRKSGVLALSGYGIRVQVSAGHLLTNDGIADERRTIRLPRVNHGLRRLVIIGSDGFVTLEALRWLADQDAAFVMLERDGSVLATTGPVRPSDARLRRAQALASSNGTALEISRELIKEKLAAQERLLVDRLPNSAAAESIAQAREHLENAKSVDGIRICESQAAHAYWSAWRKLTVNFPNKDFARIPEHWLSFGTRISPLTGSPRLSINPPNAMLNYLYAVLESESRLAAAALGLDPGIGFMHVDSKSRDSLACDLMEPVRPQVDAYVLDWITSEPLHREWFFEQRDGNCRLMSSLATRLSETANTWRHAVAPFAEWVARTLWQNTRKHPSESLPPTRLTQNRRREGRGISASVPLLDAPKPPRICLGCGARIVAGRNYCSACGVVIATESLVKAAKRGRVAAQSSDAQASRTETQRLNAMAQLAWDKSSACNPIDEETYRNNIQPRLCDVKVSAIRVALNVCASYAADIRTGRRRPHPRHWSKLAELAGTAS